MLLWDGAPVTITQSGFSDNSCGFGAGRDKVTVLLAPLGNYGGPTLTHLPLLGSSAIDNGTGLYCPPTDQRGVARPVGIGCDVGAVERQPGDFGYWLNLPLISKLLSRIG